MSACHPPHTHDPDRQRAGIAGWFTRNRLWLALQRYLMGMVLGALALKPIGQQRHAA